MNSPDPETLSQWLEVVQGYPVTPSNAQRIAQVLDGALKAQKAAASHSLFWTEPANLATTLSAAAHSESDGE